MSIRHIAPKIKSFSSPFKKADFLLFLAFILIAFSSFGLGRLSKNEAQNEPVKIFVSGREVEANEVPETAKIDNVKASLVEKGFVASKRGSKYYSVDCPSGIKLKEENKIYFKTEEEAKTAGYTLSTSC